MTSTSKLIFWVISSALIMFVAHIWLPELLSAIGLIVGFVSVVIVERLMPLDNFTKDAVLFTVYISIVALSYFVLSTACGANLVSQCGERQKNVLLLSGIGFLGAAIIPLYVFGWIPRHIRNWMRK